MISMIHHNPQNIDTNETPPQSHTRNWFKLRRVICLGLIGGILVTLAVLWCLKLLADKLINDLICYLFQWWTAGKGILNGLGQMPKG